MGEAAGILLGLITGATMAVAISGVWVVLHLPARVSGRLRACGTRLQALAIILGMGLSAAGLAGVQGSLPAWAGSAAMLGGGAFVGMLSCALGEILEAVPVLSHRFHLGEVSKLFRWGILLGKGAGALLAGLLALGGG